jgi:ATP:ADP antiporter, AAA family
VNVLGIVPAPGRRRNRIDRFLSMFTVVRAGEGGTALLLSLNVFFLLAAYYCVKPARESFILAGNGAEVKSYAAAGQAVLLLGLVPLYGALADRLPRRRLLAAVTAFFVLCLIAFHLAARAGLPVGVPFFLWVGIFNLMIVAQFWAFANDLYTPERGERLFPIVAFGGSLGAVAGSSLAGALIPRFGVAQLLPLAAGLLLVALGLSRAADARERREESADATTPPVTDGSERTATGRFIIRRDELLAAVANAESVDAAEAKVLPATDQPPPMSPFRLVANNRFLLGIALLMLVVNWVNTTGEYVLGRTVAASAAQRVSAGTAGGQSAGELIGAFYSRFFLVVNATGLALQLLVVPRLLRRCGVRTAVLVLPALAFAGYAVVGFAPVLALVRWVKTVENAVDYSLQNTIRNVLFLPTTREQKYKAKQVIDSLFVRAGDVLAALSVLIGTRYLALEAPGFARINLVLVLVWLVLAAGVGRSYARLTGESR